MVSRDTSDAKLVKTQEEMHEVRTTLHREMMAKVLGTYEGRHILYNVLALGDIYEQRDSMSYGLAESQRAIGRREMSLDLLKDILTADPNAYIVMQQEVGAFEEKFEVVEDAPEEDEDDDDHE